MIENDGKNSHDCLSKVIQEWLKRMHNEREYGTPTWSNLVKALKPIDNGLALNIEQKHCPIKGKNYFPTNTPAQVCVNMFPKGCYAF